MGARQIPAGTVARGFLRQDTVWWEGKDAAGEFVPDLPPQVEISRELLAYGRERFDIFCSVCHDSTGGGRGMIVRRSFKQPPPLYEDRLLALPAGYFFDVITNGFGTMSSYARPLTASDRWAVVAYIRVLQLARTTRESELPAALRDELHAALAAAEAGAPDRGTPDRGGTPEEEGHH
jgi:mono/diheme cytochrome c family protein